MRKIVEFPLMDSPVILGLPVFRKALDVFPKEGKSRDATEKQKRKKHTRESRISTQHPQFGISESQ